MHRIRDLAHGGLDPGQERVRARGLDPSFVRNRGLGGAEGVLELAQWIEGKTTFSR
jgi:hypothetical protein